MTEPKHKFSSKDIWRMLPGILISVIALAAVFYFADIEKVAEALRLLDYRVVPFAIVVFLFSISARAVAWRTVLQEKITLGKTFWTLNEGYLLNNVFPFRLGELGRALLLSRTAKLSFWEVLSTILVERSFDLVMMVAMLLGSLPFVFDVPQAREVTIGAGIIVMFGFIFLFLLARNKSRAIFFFDKLVDRWPKLSGIGREKLISFFTGLGALTNVRRFWQVFFWMLISWLMNVSWYYILLLGFLPDAPFLWALFGVGMVSLGVAVPSSPAFLGVLEAALVWALSLFGVDFSVALAFAILAHANHIMVTTIFGVFGLVRDGESLGRIYWEIRQTQK